MGLRSRISSVGRALDCSSNSLFLYGHLIVTGSIPVFEKFSFVVL